MIGSLFSGIGGLELGLERAGLGRVVWQAERDSYCRAVLRKHWPDVIRLEEVRDVRANGTIPGVDLICGGFPCQPFSVAGAQKAEDDDRYLWPEFARVVEEFRPSWVVAENVPGIRNLAADRVCDDLESLGFEVWPLVVGAVHAGAPHRRQRVFFVARHADRNRESALPVDAEVAELPRDASDAERERQPRPWASRDASYTEAAGEGKATEPRYGRVGNQWRTEPDVGRVAHGVPSRVDRLRSLGNAVVPQVAEMIGRAILSAGGGPCASN